MPQNETPEAQPQQTSQRDISREQEVQERDVPEERAPHEEPTEREDATSALQDADKEVESAFGGENEGDRDITENIRVDAQGNPIDEQGRLIVEKIDYIDNLSDDYFMNPTKSVQLPDLPERIDNAIGAGGKPVIIKKSIFEKNLANHPKIGSGESRYILQEALYNPTLYGQSHKATRPYKWVLISLPDGEGSNNLVVLELNHNKDNVEILGWHYVDERGAETIKRQAAREGDHILILPSEESEEAGATSSPTHNPPSNDKATQKVPKSQAGRSVSQTPKNGEKPSQGATRGGVSKKENTNRPNVESNKKSVGAKSAQTENPPAQPSGEGTPQVGIPVVPPAEAGAPRVSRHSQPVQRPFSMSSRISS